jgi:hypothetical protein
MGVRRRVWAWAATAVFFFFVRHPGQQSQGAGCPAGPPLARSAPCVFCAGQAYRRGRVANRCA